MTTKTKETTKSKTSTDKSTTKELVEISRAFTEEIQGIMTARISFVEKSKALGTATKHFAEYIDQFE